MTRLKHWWQAPELTETTLKSSGLVSIARILFVVSAFIYVEESRASIRRQQWHIILPGTSPMPQESAAVTFACSMIAHQCHPYGAHGASEDGGFSCLTLASLDTNQQIGPLTITGS
jgi:hypothetical protein